MSDGLHGRADALALFIQPDFHLLPMKRDHGACISDGQRLAIRVRLEAGAAALIDDTRADFMIGDCLRSPPHLFDGHTGKHVL